MGQQISIEAALESYRRRAEELFHENVLLRARVQELEQAAPAESLLPEPAAAYPGDAVYEPGHSGI